MPAGLLTNFGYEDQVLLISEIAAPAQLAADAVTISARANWLVCKDVCIPESGEFSLVLPVAQVSRPVLGPAEEFARARELLPVSPGGWRFEAQAEGSHALLSIEPPAGRVPQLPELTYFPYAEGQIEPSAPQHLARVGSAHTLAIARAQQPVGPFDRVHGILVAEQGFGVGGPRAIAIDVPVSGTVTASIASPVEVVPAAAPAGSIGLALALGLALVGGLLLNLMPCVFPILSIKVLGVMQHDTAAQARRYGLAYGLGVVASFVLLAALLFALRSAGEQLGWGFQLQSPVFVAALALLFFLLGLNLSGAFEFGHLLPQRPALFATGKRWLDAALSGLLAVVAASPCTAPFMGSALGYAVGRGTAFVREREQATASESDLLAGRSIIVLDADFFHRQASARGLGNLVAVSSAAEAMKRLSAGQGDAVLIARLVGLQTLRELGIRNVTPAFSLSDTRQKFAFAVRKGESELLAGINEALAEVKASGRYAALYQKWFGILEPRRYSITEIVGSLTPVLLVLALVSLAYMRQRRLTKELARSSASLRAMMDNVPYVMWLKTADGRFVAVNQPFARACGQPDPLSVVGKNSFDVWPPEIAEAYVAQDQRVLESRQQQFSEQQMEIEGRISWFEALRAPVI